MSHLACKPRHRVQGRPAITRSLHALYLRTCRFAQHRATDRADVVWAAAVLDALAHALTVARGDDRPDPEVPDA